MRHVYTSNSVKFKQKPAENKMVMIKNVNGQKFAKAFPVFAH